MKRLRAPGRLASAWLLLLLGLGSACGRTRADDSHDDDPGPAAGRGAAGGDVSAPGGATQGGAATGGAVQGGAAPAAFGGTGVAVGGAPPVAEAGAPSSGGPRVAVPLSDTRQCENEFVRVAQLQDMTPFFSAVLDDEAVEVQRDLGQAESPQISVLRFGERHIEHVGTSFVIPERHYRVSIGVGAVNCDVWGFIFLDPADGLPPFMLETATIRTITHSVDGFSGWTRGRIESAWTRDDGERHVLSADFLLQATMPDTRAELL